MVTDDTIKKLNAIVKQNLFETAAKLSECIEQELDIPRENIKIEYVNGKHNIFIKTLGSIKDITVSIAFGDK